MSTHAHSGRNAVTTWTLLALSLALLAPRPAAAQDTAAPEAPATSATVPTVAEVARDLAGTLWYGVYMQGNKIGHAELTVTVGDGPDATYRERFDVSMNLRSLGQDVTMEVIEEFEAFLAPDGAVASILKSQSGPMGSEIVKVSPVADGYEAAITQAGETRTQAVDLSSFGLGDHLAGPAWLRTDPAPGATKEIRVLDRDSLTIETDTLRLDERVTTVVDGVPTHVYRVTLTDHEGSTGSLVFNARGQLLSFVFGGMIEGRVEPEEIAKDPGQPVDLFLNNVVRTDRPLGTQVAVTKLRVRISDAQARALDPATGQSIETTEDGGHVLTVEPSAGERVAATEKEIADASAEDVDHPIRHERVQALASEAVGDAATAAEKVARLVSFVADYVEDDLHAEQNSVLDIIASKRGDCSEHTDLMTTLCRAAGIPARSVSGIMYMGDEVGAFGGHAWTEVVLDGIWTPVDATWKQTRVDGTHIRYPTVKSREVGAMAAFGGSTLEVLEVVPAAE